MSKYKMTSEVLMEKNSFPVEVEEGTTISQFIFKLPSYMCEPAKDLKYDEDGDLILNRKNKGILLIEHCSITELHMVGLQIWRGAFLLADFILSYPELFKNQTILELGSGVGLSSIIASILAKEVICTDVNRGDILKLIEENFIKNKAYIKSKTCITELDFLNLNWSCNLQQKMNNVSIILAADVIYDDNITEGFVKTLEKLFSLKIPKVAYVTLEKRYVFTVQDLESVAPMYEEFLRYIRRFNIQWKIEYIPVDFPQYFQYNRKKELILMKIQNQ